MRYVEPKKATLYSYTVSGYYMKDGFAPEEEYFYETVYATSSSEAMKIVLGTIMWENSLEENFVKMTFIHCDCN